MPRFFQAGLPASHSTRSRGRLPLPRPRCARFTDYPASRIGAVGPHRQRAVTELPVTRHASRRSRRNRRPTEKSTPTPF